MKAMKKILALALAAAMVLAMSVTAFADGVELTDHDATASNNEAVRIYKELTVYNPAASTVNEPTATYTYSLTAGTAGKQTTDSASVSVLTKAGITTGVALTSQTDATPGTSTSVSYVADGTNTLTASAAGTKNAKWVDIDFSGVVFGAAGVYRYVLTEDLDGAGGSLVYGSNGIIEGSVGHVRYLDVYVKEATGFTDGSTAADWQVYGYAMFASDTDLAPASEAASKTTGFIADSANNRIADAYYTFNATVSKDLVNDAAKSTNQFPFKVNFANPTVTANVLPIVSSTGTATAPTLASGDINSIALDGTSATAANQIKLADGASVTFTGIPAGTTLTFDEQNNVQGTFYTVTTSGGTTNETTGIKVPWGEWATGQTGWTATTIAQALKTSGQNMSSDTNRDVQFANTFAEISPTGVVLRIAPFGIALIAGLALVWFAFSRRKRAAGNR